MTERPTVFIVDDEPAIRESLSRLVGAAGFRAECFDGADAFLAAYRNGRPGCLVTDIRMPGKIGRASCRERV